MLDTNQPVPKHVSRHEQAVPKQLYNLNELKEHLHSIEENDYIDIETANILIEEIDKYVISFVENIVSIMKNNISS